MRILILSWKDTAHPHAGGAEVFTQQVARVLVERGDDVTLFAAGVRNRPSEETVDGVSVVRQGGKHGVYRAARRFLRQQRRGAFDVVVDHINTRPFLTPRWVVDTPIVALIHQLAREIWFYETPLPVAVLGRYVLEPWWLRGYRDVPAMTVSESSAESLRQHHGWRDVVVLPEGIALEAVPSVPKEDHPTVVFLGRLVSMKRPEDAIGAFEILRRRRDDARMWIIGEGPQLEKLSRKRPPGVEFLGRLQDRERNERIARAHVLLATSVREGWGLNVSEAAAYGTPTIGYSVPGLVDSVSRSGGALVAPSPSVLGHALIRFFDGRLSLRPMPSAVSWDEVANAFERRLEDVVNR